MDQHAKLLRAKARVEEMTGFYVHAAVYVFVNGIMLYLNTVNDPEWWVQWPILGWGIGLLAHGLAVFGQTPRFIRTWQLRKIHDLEKRMV